MENTPPIESANTPVESAPDASTTPASVPPPIVPPVHPHTNKHLLLLVLIASGAILLFATTIVVMAAYGTLPIGSRAFRASMADFIQSLPFTPKSADFVARKAIVAAQDMKKYTIDASFAMESTGMNDVVSLTSIVPGGAIDVAVKGPIDFSDPNKPKLDVNLTVTKDFNTDIRYKEEILYFKINKIPPSVGILLASFGMPDKILDLFVNKWFFYDSRPVYTEARQNVDEQRKDDAGKLGEKIGEAIAKAVLEGKIAPKVSMTSEDVDKVATHKLHIIMEKKDIDALEETIYTATREFEGSSYAGGAVTIQPKKDEKYKPELSKTVETLDINVWVDKSSYYTRKFSLSFKIKPEAPNASADIYSSPQSTFLSPFTSQSKQDIPVSLVVKYSDIGKEVNVETPKDVVRFEEYVQKVFEENIASTSAFSPQATSAQADNARRKSDVNVILNAINQYMADNQGVLPPGITAATKSISKDGADLCGKLVPTYLVSIPADPKINFGRGISDCTANYLTGYTISQDPASGRIIISAPYADLGEIITVKR